MFITIYLNGVHYCGLIDATFFALLVIEPSEAEILDAETKVHKLLSVWHAQKKSDTLKVHICEHRMIHTMRELGGLGDKDESFIDLLQQDGRRHERH
jgi:hypothetical protein